MDNRELAREDERLADAALAGRTGAFEQIVQKYFGTVHAVCFAHVRNRETAEELSQEVFLRVYLNMSSLKNRRTLASWVSQIARNLSRDWLRRGQTKSRMVPLVPLDSLGSDIPDPARPSPLATAADAEEQRLLITALDNLPGELREVVLLHFTEGLSKSEIARRLDLFPSSVSRRLDRALELLRDDLQPRLQKGMSALRPNAAAMARVVALAAAASQLTPSAKAALIAAGGGVMVGAATTGVVATVLSPIAGGGTVAKAAAAVVVAAGSLAGVMWWSQHSADPVRAAAPVEQTAAKNTETGRPRVRAIGQAVRPRTSAVTTQPRARSSAAATDLTTQPAVLAAATPSVEPPPADPTTATLRLHVRDWSTSKPIEGLQVRLDSSISQDPLARTLSEETGVSDPNLLSEFRVPAENTAPLSFGSVLIRAFNFSDTRVKTTPALPVPATAEITEPGEVIVRPLKPGEQVVVTLFASGYNSIRVGPYSAPPGATKFEKTIRMAAMGGLEGRLVEPGTRTPVPGVKLARVGAGPTSGTSAETAPIVTGEDGRFLIMELPSGSVRLHFTPEQTWPPFMREFTTVQGRTKDVGDIEVIALPSSIRGRVIRMPGEEPVPGQTVELTKREDTRFNQSTITDADGEFQFPSLENGTYIAWVREPGIFQQVTLGSEDQKDLTLRIGSVKLRGRVTRDGEPVMANIHLSQGATGFLKEMSARTDPDGYFTLENVSAGWWLGAVHATSLKGTWNDWFAIPETDLYEYEFVIPSGKVIGLVQGPDGQPVHDARVYIVKNDSGTFDVTKPAVALDTRSLGDGRFTLNSAKGRFQLRAKKDGVGLSVPVEVEVPESGETAPVLLKLKPTETGTIQSIAMDYADGSPLKAATLNLYDSSSRVEVKATRDEDGVMTLTEIVPGQYRVIVSSPGYSVDERHIEVAAGETITIESVLYEGGIARVVVQDEFGEYLPGVHVEVVPEDAASIEEVRKGTTSRGGLVMVRGLMPGGYLVRANTTDGRQAEARIKIRPREITDWLLAVR